MNKNVIIGLVVVVVLFLAAPLVLSALKSGGGGEGESAGGGSASGNAAPAAPLLNTENLTGTAWEVKTKELPVAVTIQLNPGGQAVATVPPAFSGIAKQMIGTDTLVGTWTASGSNLTATVQVKNDTHRVTCQIVGDKIMYEGKEVKRVR